MGVIRPPWVSKDWFTKCPFNYCDHFGDQELLATVCKVCRQELERIEKYKREGKDPHDLKNVFNDVGENLANALAMVAKQAGEMGIDLENLPDPPESPQYENYPIFNTVNKYGKTIEKTINALREIPIDADTEVVIKAAKALTHSRHYIIAKIGRAVHSKWDEKQDPSDELDDSKTSAFLAYIAIERNSRALLSLAKHQPLAYLKEKHLKLAHTSLKLCEAIAEDFFPKDNLVYEEFGYVEY